MKRNRILFLLLLWLLSVWPEFLQAQSLQVALSPGTKVNRTTSGGTATIFFDSSIEDLSIVCTEEDPNETIIKINDHQWFVNINVNKDIETDGVCYRNYLLKCSASAEYFLTTDEIVPNQVLYYTITLPNELEPKLLEEKARNIAAKANQLVDEGDSYLARILLLTIIAYPLESTLLPEVESAVRKANLKDDAFLYGNKSSICSFSLSPSDNYIVSGSYAGDIRIWERSTGVLCKVLLGHTKRVKDVKYFSNERKIASISYDKTLKIWDVDTNKCLKTIDLPYSEPNCIAISENEKYIAIGYKNGGISIVNINNSYNVVSHNAHSLSITNVIWSFNHLITASNDATIKIWDIKKWNCLNTLLGHDCEVSSMAIDPTGNYLASVAHWDDYIRIWDLQRGTLLSSMDERSSRFTAIAYSNDGKNVVTTSEDGTIRVWDISQKSIINTIENYPIDPNIIKYGTHANFIVTLSYNQSLRIIDLDETIKGIRESSNGINGYISASPIENAIAYSCSKTIVVKDLDSKCEIRWNGQAEFLHNNILFSPDGLLLANVGYDNTLRIWNKKNGQLLHELKASGHKISFSPDGQHIACSGKEINIWEVATGKLEKTIENAFNSNVVGLQNISFSHNGQFLASVLDDFTIAIYSTVSWELCYTINCDQYVSSICWAIDDNTLLVASESSIITVWDIKTGEKQKEYKGHTEGVNDAIYTKDGRYVLSCGFDHKIRIWDAQSCKEILSLYAPVYSDSKLSLSKDDTKIFMGSISHVCIWDFPTIQQLINETRERFKNRQLTFEEKVRCNLE